MRRNGLNTVVLTGFSSACNNHQNLCIGISVWNHADPILKERLFGLTGSEGNHGEDVKEYYFYLDRYTGAQLHVTGADATTGRSHTRTHTHLRAIIWPLDSTPTHSYMKYLYKYPMDEYPYAKLVKENQARDRTQQEFELYEAMPSTWAKVCISLHKSITHQLQHHAHCTDSYRVCMLCVCVPGIQNHYFDVFVEYAKADENDILCAITAVNRSKDRGAPITIMPQLWFRNVWSWGYAAHKPSAEQVPTSQRRWSARASAVYSFFTCCFYSRAFHAHTQEGDTGSVKLNERHIGQYRYYVCAPEVEDTGEYVTVPSALHLHASRAVVAAVETSPSPPRALAHTRRLSFTPPDDMLFTENETNNKGLFGSNNASPYVKDAFHRHVVK